jgi:hypothetical protein
LRRVAVNGEGKEPGNHTAAVPDVDITRVKAIAPAFRYRAQP